MQRIDRHLQEIGKTALDGLLRNELSFPEKVFCRCMEAVDTGCKVGVISREKRIAPKSTESKMGRVKSCLQLFYFRTSYSRNTWLVCISPLSTIHPEMSSTR